jgi:DHA1 family multidrug resistance protein-like MFS transporter
MSQSEINQRNMKVSAVAIDALIKPLEITLKDPAVLFVQVYTAIIYGIYYSFFEVFPLVYPVDYHMNLGQIGLVFLCILVSCIVGIVSYVAYIHYYMNPRIRKYGFGAQESRLIPALPTAFGPTIGLFLFAWTARASIHWIVPTIGITIYGATVFVVMQCIFVYIPMSYPMYAASLFAANDFFRSALACGSVLFAHPLFGNLGVARGVSLLGGLSVIGIVGIWLLYFYGARLRSMSRFAVSNDVE